MNVRQCTYLLTIEECGYLSHAAVKLNLSQAALSKFLDEQERLAGTPLFSRHKKRLIATPAGKIILDTASEFLQVKNYTLQAISAIHASTASIRMVSTPYRGTEMFSRVYTRFMANFTGLDLILGEAFSLEQEEMIHTGQADFACGANYSSRYHDVMNLPFAREEVVIAVPRFHPLAEYASEDTAQLVSMPLRIFTDTPFVLASQKSNIRRVADELFERAGFQPVIAFESDNNMAVDSMLRQGRGVGFISRRYVRPDPELVFYRLDPPCYEITCLRYSKERVFTEQERYLCGLIIRERLQIPNNEMLRSQATDEFLSVLTGNDRLEADARI